MARLELHLYGSFQATLDGQPLHGFRSNKVRALLAYLALEAGRDHPRQRLATLLWGEYPTHAALLSLRVSLSNLRQILAPLWAGGQDAPLLVTTRESVRFAPLSPGCWVDVAEFDALLAACYSHAHGEMARCRACVRRLARAESLYRGDLLADLVLRDSPAFDEWRLLEQEMRRQQALAALAILVSHHAATGRYAQALRYGRRLVEMEPWAEVSHRQLMRLLALSGQPSAALAQYEACRRLLADDLGLEPAPETTELYERIRTGSFDDEGRPEAAGSLPGPSAARAPFVGREAELARLAALLEESLAGRGQVVFVTGGAGSGKTALLGEFARRATAAHQGVAVAWGQCESSAGSGDPYLPFRDLLASLAGEPGGEASGEAAMPHLSRPSPLLPALVKVLLEQGPDLIDRLVPRGTLLKGARREPAPWLDRLESAVAEPPAGALPQTNLFQQVTRVLQALARQVALILVLDDLQWADTASLSLLFHLGRRLAGSRILIAGAYRPSDVALGRQSAGSDRGRHPLDPVVHELQRRYGQVEIALEPGGRRFVDALLDTEPNHLDGSFRASLTGRTGGQPLFTVELLHSLQEQGGLVTDDDGCWVQGPHLDWDRLPARVEAVIAERMARLPPDPRRMLAVASVQGQEFSAEVVARILDLDVGEAVAILSELLGRQHRLVQPQGPSQAGGQALSRYRFRHYLFQSFLYGSLDPIERARYHAATGRALEALLGDQPLALEAMAPHLARHYREAGQPAKAMGYLQQAARRSVRLSANSEALVHLEAALELLPALPEGPARDGQEVSLRLALYAPLIATESYASPRLGRSNARTQALCRKIGDTPQLLPACMCLAGFSTMRAEFATALAYAEKALALAEKGGEGGYALWAQQVIGLNRLHQGDPAAARRHMAAPGDTDEAEQQAMLVVRGTDPLVAGHAWNAWILWLLGHPDRAQACTRAGLRRARMLGHAHSLAVALLIGGIYPAQMRRELDDLPAWLEELAALATRHEIGHMQALARLYQGWLLARTDPDQAPIAVSRMEEALAAWRATGMKSLEPVHLGVLADACLCAGLRAKAQRALDAALATAAETGDHAVTAELHRLRGKLLLAQSDGVGARACFEQAIEVARQQQARSLELRATVRLARLLQSRGQPEEGRRLLAGVYGWFSEGFHTPDLEEARSLLEELRAGGEA